MHASDNPEERPSPIGPEPQAPAEAPSRKRLAETEDRHSRAGPQLTRIDEICDQFEAAWRAGGTPDLEEYIARACEADRAELERELKAVQDQLRLLAPPQSAGGRRVAESGQATAGADSQPAIRYRVLRFHARGGLGKVSLAIDEELHREVALKELLDRRADDPGCRSRFLCEAEVTGSLEHPGVVPVYGLGTYPDGRPYYAMRFIRGGTLEEAIDHFHALPSAGARGRHVVEFYRLLRRFLDVCNTIEYAHSRGIIHRDLKPRNVMLGSHGETLVVDWGLAKVVGRTGEYAQGPEPTIYPASGSQVPATEYGSAIGTPAYMSPEQAAGEHDRVGVGADIYSLGAVLYHLLTGRPAFTEMSLDQMLEKVRLGDFPRPRQVNPRIARPLESICLKAMALRHADRYPTVAALADDLEHWLADERVGAHREKPAEIALRWMRRHRSWTWAGAAALVLVALVSVVAAWMVNRQRQAAVGLAASNAVLAEKEQTARRDALARFRDAQEATDTWLTGAADALQYYPGVQEARRRMLEKAAENYERFSRAASGDPQLEVERGRVYLRLGDIRRTLEKPAEAVQAYLKARDLFSILSGAHPELADAAVEKAGSRIKLALALADCGRHAEADAECSVAISDLRARIRIAPEDRRAWETLAAGLMNRGNLLAATGARDEAESLLRQAVREWEGLVEATQQPRRLPPGLPVAQAALGQLLLDRGQPAEAMVELAQSIRNLDALVEAEPDDPALREWRAATRISLAAVQRRCGLCREEEESYGHAIADYRDLIQALPDVPAYQEYLALTRNDLAILHHHLGRNSEAEAGTREALADFTRLAADYPQVQGHREGLAACHDTLAQILSDMAREAEARSAAEAAIEAYRGLMVLNPDVSQYRERLAVCQSHLGYILGKLGERDQFEAAFREAIESFDRLVRDAPGVPAFRNELAFAMFYQGTLLWEEGKAAQAEPLLRRAGELWQAIAGENPAAEYLDNLAWFLANAADPRLRNPQAAVALARQATESARENACYWNTLGAACYRARDWNASRDALREAARRREKHGRDGFFTAMVFQELGNLEKASEAYRWACQWTEKNQPGNLELSRLRAEAAKLLEAASLPPPSKP